MFSADGKHDNPDAPTVEALVKIHGQRKIVLHFTNEDVTWSEVYKTREERQEGGEAAGSAHRAEERLWRPVEHEHSQGGRALGDGQADLNERLKGEHDAQEHRGVL